MNDSARGALWSALVFPGSGQIVLNHRKRGLSFALFTATGIVITMVTVVRGTWTGLEQQALNGSEISISLMGTVALASLAAAKKYILLPMILCWAFSVIDAARLGRSR